MNVELPIEDMTWGELRALVELAAHLPDDKEVLFDYDATGGVQSIFVTGLDHEELLKRGS